MHWESFEQEVLQFIQADIFPQTDRIAAPIFNTLLTIGQEVPELNPYCRLNLFETVAMHSHVSVSGNIGVIGDIDGCVKRNNTLTIIYEVKGKWSLNPNWFQNKQRIDGTNLTSYIQNAINQLYTYMVWNHMKYGILTSFDFTFFFKRVVAVCTLPSWFRQVQRSYLFRMEIGIVEYSFF